ncbi:hypothetical protein IFR05_014089 [Cadophora sp. M221]|nr:hypothetical protein IFR05_014089 [Cadophora sp. M221]
MSSMTAIQGDPSTKVIKFTLPGLIADVRLKVFDTEYNVNSTLIKIYSVFFRKLLDSPDKKDSNTAYEPFKYEYFSKQSTTSPVRLPTMIYSVDCLDATIGRRSFNYSFLNSDPCKMLSVAKQPRHRDLFKECLILTLGPFSAPRFHKLEDIKLRKLAENAYAGVGLQVANTQKALLSQMDGHRTSNTKLKQEMQDHIENSVYMSRTGTSPASSLLLAAYYRALWSFESQVLPKT